MKTLQLHITWSLHGRKWLLPPYMALQAWGSLVAAVTWKPVPHLSRGLLATWASCVELQGAPFFHCRKEKPTWALFSGYLGVQPLGGWLGVTLLGGSLLYPRLPGCAGTRGQSPSKGHWSYACSHLVCKRPGPQYAVCSGSCELSRHLVVKIITVFCSSSCHDYRVPLSRAHTLYNQLLALFLAETSGMGSCCLHGCAFPCPWPP